MTASLESTHEDPMVGISIRMLHRSAFTFTILSSAFCEVHPVLGGKDQEISSVVENSYKKKISGFRGCFV